MQYDAANVFEYRSAISPSVQKWTIIVTYLLPGTRMIGSLVVLGLTVLWDNISVYIGPSPKEREKEERKDRWE